MTEKTTIVTGAGRAYREPIEVLDVTEVSEGLRELLSESSLSDELDALLSRAVIEAWSCLGADAVERLAQKRNFECCDVGGVVVTVVPCVSALARLEADVERAPRASTNCTPTPYVLTLPPTTSHLP